ncbi:MAG: AarF/UbiB family protein [Acidobacteriota bacterium]
MLKQTRTPTRLIDPATRAKVPIVVPLPPSRYRSWQVLGNFLSLTAVLLALAVRRRLTTEESARRLRELFERMGGLWIKAGQLLSLRIDIFPVEICHELSKLQSRAIGFPGEMARRIVEEELGGPIEDTFDEFGDVPFAAASIGQVHRAHLRHEDEWVAVKVQKPYSFETFSRDLVFIEWVVRALHLLRIYPHMRWDDGLYELRQIMREELDFDFEASSMRRMRRTLRKHDIYVPRVFGKYSTERVLVSEFIHAVLMADYIKVALSEPARVEQWVHENGIDSRRLAKRMIHSLFRQLFEDNLYHGDMHPGNIVLLRDNRVALIDFGSTNFTEREYLQKFRLFARALATRDYAKAADLCFMLCATLPAIDIEHVKEKLIRTIRAWATRTLVKQLPYHEKSIDNATIEIMKVLLGYKCTMDWGWLRIHRAMSTLDASLIYLYPDVNYTKVVQQYFAKADRRDLGQMLGRGMMMRTLGSVKTSLDIQDRVNEYTMFQGSLIRRHAQVFQGATNKFADVFAGLVGLLSVAVLVPGLVFAMILSQQFYPDATLQVFGSQVVALANRFPKFELRVWVVIIAVNFYLYYSLNKLKRRLRQKDVRQQHERVASV